MLGIGPDNFRLTYGRYLGLAAWDSRVHANNTYLEVLVGMGVDRRCRAGVADRRRAADRRSPGCRAADVEAMPLVAAATAACLAIAAHALVDSFLTFTSTYVVFALAAGVLFAAPCPPYSSVPRNVSVMRIAFDGTTLTPGRTGVGYYTEHLLQHLAREVGNTGDEIVVVSNKPIDTERRCRRTCACTRAIASRSASAGCRCARRARSRRCGPTWRTSPTA